MANLIIEPNLPDADAFYKELTDLHRDLNNEQSRDVNARLILLLSNHIGDHEALSQAMNIAREHIPPQGE
ncbi:MAG: DUF2783 domain-containing protein [Amphritea sp.]|nr:DUF2783 domain-containing protein [Amphritea sp.]